MYKDGRTMDVTDDPAGRSELAKHGWTETETVKKKSAKKVVADDNSK
jgi:hypothetical protein